MNMKLTMVGVGLAMLAMSSCKSHYELVGVERTRIVIDSRYDAAPNDGMVAFLAPYKQQVDSAMGPVMGTVAHNMSPKRPESDLSNLLSDILLWAGKDYGEQPVLAIQNMGGIRADLTKGKVTYGDVVDVAPFENKICFVTLTGEQLMRLFAQIAKKGGEGVSHGCELVITKDGRLVSARLNGEEIDPQKEYRLATIDYLLNGNDNLNVLSEGKDINSPQGSGNNTRFVFMKYFKEKAAQGETVDAKVEGRIVVKLRK